LEGVGYLIGIQQRIGPVDEQKINIIGVEIGQRLVCRLHNMFFTGVIIIKPDPFEALVGQLDATFGYKLDLWAQAGLQIQRLAKKAFASVTPINIGMVEGVDAEFEILMDEVQQALLPMVPGG
jgi:hypothetical protein